MSSVEKDKLEELFRLASEKSPCLSVGETAEVIKNAASLAVPSIPQGLFFTGKGTSIVAAVTVVAVVGVGVLVLSDQSPKEQTAPPVVMVMDEPEPVEEDIAVEWSNKTIARSADRSQAVISEQEPAERSIAVLQQSQVRPESNVFELNVLEPRAISTLIYSDSIEGYKELEKNGIVSAWSDQAFSRSDGYPFVSAHDERLRTFEISADWTSDHLDSLLVRAVDLGISASFHKVRYKKGKLNSFNLVLAFGEMRCVCKARNIQASGGANGSEASFRIDGALAKKASTAENHRVSQPEWVVSETGTCLSLTHTKETCRSACQCDPASTLFTLNLR